MGEDPLEVGFAGLAGDPLAWFLCRAGKDPVCGRFPVESGRGQQGVAGGAAA